MTRYAKVKIGHYRRRDGSKIKAHTRRIKVSRGSISRWKERRALLKGKLSEAKKTGNPTKIARLRARIKQVTRHIGGHKRAGRLYKQGMKYQKRKA